MEWPACGCVCACFLVVTTVTAGAGPGKGAALVVGALCSVPYPDLGCALVLLEYVPSFICPGRDCCLMHLCCIMLLIRMLCRVPRLLPARCLIGTAAICIGWQQPDP